MADFSSNGSGFTSLGANFDTLENKKAFKIAEIDQKVLDKIQTNIDAEAAKAREFVNNDFRTDPTDLMKDATAAENPVGYALNLGGSLAEGIGSLANSFLSLPEQARALNERFGSAVTNYLYDKSPSYRKIRENPAYQEVGKAVESVGNLYKAETQGLSEVGNIVKDKLATLHNDAETKRVAEEASAAYDEADSFVQGVINMVEVGVVDNPAVALDTFVNSLPQMYALAKKGVQGAISFLAITGDNIEEELATFKETHNGREPNADELALIVGTAAVATAVDTVESKFVLKPVQGSKSLTALNNAAGKALDTVTKSRIGTKLASVPFGRTATKFVTSAPAEALQEGFQQYITEVGGKQTEASLTSPDTLRQTYVAATLGLGAGGAGGAAVQVKADLAKTTADAGAFIRDRKNKADPDYIETSDPVAEFTPSNAFEGGDGQIVTIDLGNNYNPRAALDEVFSREILPSTTPEEKTATLNEARLHLNNLYGQYNALSENDQLRPENQKLAQDIVNAAAEIKSLAQSTFEDDINTLNSEESTQEEKVAANDRIFGSLMDDDLSSEQLDMFAESDNSLLDEDSKAAVAATQRLEKARKVIVFPGKGSGEVHNNIVHGGFDKKTGRRFVGGEEWLGRIRAAVQAGNIEAAQKNLSQLAEFATRQQDKVDAKHKEQSNGIEHSPDFLERISQEAEYLAAAVEQAKQLIVISPNRTGNTTEPVLSKQNADAILKAADDAVNIARQDLAQKENDETATVEDVQRVAETEKAAAKTKEAIKKKQAEKPTVNSNVQTNSAKTNRMAFQLRKMLTEKADAGKVREFARETLQQLRNERTELKKDPKANAGRIANIEKKYTEIRTAVSNYIAAAPKTEAKKPAPVEFKAPHEFVAVTKKSTAEGALNPNTKKPYDEITLSDVASIKPKASSILVDDVISNEDEFINAVGDHIGAAQNLSTSEKNDIKIATTEVHKQMRRFNNKIKQVPAEFVNGVNKLFTSVAHKNLSVLLMKPNSKGELYWSPAVVAAMYAGVAAWIAEEGTSTITNTYSDLQHLLGFNEEDHLPPATVQRLRDIGKPLPVIADSIGARIYQGLGIKMADDVDYNTRARLIRALGMEALSTAQEMGAVNFNSITVDELNSMFNEGSYEDAQGNALFVRMPPKKEGEYDANTAAEALSKPFKDNKKLASTLFGLDTFITGPSDKPNTHVQTRTADDLSGVPEEQQKMLRKLHKRAYGINVPAATKILSLGSDFIYKMTGYKNLDGSHKQNLDAHKSINRGIDKAITDLQDAIETHGTNDLFFSWDVWSNSRMGIRSNTLNPQANKFHRAFVAPRSQAMLGIDPTTNNEKMDAFAHAVALAFGASDKGGAKQTQDFFIELKDNPHMLNAVELIQQKNPDPDAVYAELDALGAADMHGFGALMDMVEYYNALKTGKKFDSTIGIETDGVTNGSAIGMLMLPILDNIGGWLERMGIYTAASKFRGYAEWYNYKNEAGQRANNDSYEFLMERVIDHLRAEKPNFYRALEILTGGNLAEYLESDEVLQSITKDGRSIAKQPFMVFNYGSSLDTIGNNLAETMVDTLYNRLEKINQMEGAKQEAAIAEFNEALAILDNLNSVPNAVDLVAASKDNLLSVSYEGQTRRQLAAVFHNQLSDPFTGTLEVLLGKFANVRTLINGAFTAQFNAFEMLYNDKITAAENENFQRVGDRTLTESQLHSIYKELEDVIPGFNGPMSSDPGARVLVYKERKVLDAHGLVKIYYQNKNRSLGTKSTTTHVYQKLFTNGGVSGMVKMVHTIDSSVMTRVLDKFDVVNIHDAVIANPLQSAKVAKYYNKKLAEVARSYSLLQDVINNLDRIMSKLSPAQVRMLNSDKDFKIRISSTNPQNDQPQNEYLFVNRLRTRIKEMQATLKPIRQQIMGKGTIIEQMPSTTEQSGYEVQGNEKAIPAGSPLRREDPQHDSSPDFRINPATFKAKTTTKVTSDNVAHIYETLFSVGSNPNLSPEHRDRLNSVVNDIVKQGIVPLNEIILAIKEDQEGVFGATIGNRVYVNNRPTSSTNLPQTSAEVFAHELVHAVLIPAFKANPNLKAELTKLYDLAKQNVRPEDFLLHDANGNVVVVNDAQAEMEAAQRYYDYIFGKTSFRAVGKDLRSHAVEEFLAYALTNEQLANKLGTIAVKQKTGHTTVWDRILKLLEKAFDWITLQKSKPSKADNIADAVFDIAQNVTSLESTRRESVLNAAAAGFGFVARPINRTVDIVKSSTGKFLVPIGTRMLPVVRKGIKGGTTAVKLAKKSHTAEVAIDEISRTLDTVIGLPKEFQRVYNLLSKSKQGNDTQRKQIQVDTIKQVNDGFHTDRSEIESTALTKVLLMTDIYNMSDKFSDVNELLALLRDEGEGVSKLESRMNALRAALREEKNGIEYIAQAEGLGGFMVHGKVTIAMQQLNAENIAKMKYLYGIDLKVSDKTIARIDELATLAAIKATPLEMRLAAANVIQREYAADPINNGITTIMDVAIAHQSRSNDFLFGSGTKSRLRVKGYTANILNPTINIEVAPGDKDTEFYMAERGYYKEHTVPVDPLLSLNGETEYWVYKSNMDGKIDYLSGAVSLADFHSRGTEFVDTITRSGGRTKNDAYKLQTAVYNQYLKQAKNRASGVIQQEKPTLLPKYDEYGEFRGFRYVMSEASKRELMDKDYDVANVLGAMHASVTGKVNTKRINDQVVQLLRDDFKQNFQNNPDDFVKLSGRKGSQYEEVYRLIPEDMRIQLKSSGVFNGPDFFVRKELVDIIFGYRKFSLANKFAKTTDGSPYDLNYKEAEKIHAKINKHRLRRILLMAENVWQAVIQQEKLNIVIKTPDVLRDNMVSNTLYLLIRGISPVRVLKDYNTAAHELDRYRKIETALNQLNNTLRATPKGTPERARLIQKKALLNEQLLTNNVHALVEAGVFQTIVEDIDTSKFDYRNQFVRWASNKTPALVKRAASKLSFANQAFKWAYITEDTGFFKLAHKAVAYSDFMARYSMNEQLKEQGLDEKERLVKITEAFINYEDPDSQLVQYANDMGLFMFTKFFFRIQRVVYQQVGDKTGNVLMSIALQSALADISDINDTSILETDFSARVYPSFMKHLSEAVDLKGLELIGL